MNVIEKMREREDCVLGGLVLSTDEYPLDSNYCFVLKVPFPRRSAVMEQKKAESNEIHDFIRRYATPEMLIKLRQGVGRLIRSESDTGLISILDSRAATGEHSLRVAKVLQQYPRVGAIDEIEAFFKSVKPKEYYSED